MGGKIIRESLKTSVWTTAKLRLAEFLKTQQEAKAVVVAPTFNEAVELFKRELESDNTIKPRSKEYRLTCLKKIETSWPELWTLRLDNITPAACKEWASDLNSKIASHYFNNTIGTLRQVIDVGLKAHKANGGNVFENPAAELKRVRVKQKEMTLPGPIAVPGVSGLGIWWNSWRMAECASNRRRFWSHGRMLIGLVMRLS